MPHINNNFHSEEVQEIMGRAPSWVVRWGITVIFIILTTIIIGCCIIKYPQIITTPIFITTADSTVNILIHQDGIVDKVCINNGENVRAGQIIALLTTSADYKDILLLEANLTSTDSPKTLANSPWLSNRYVLGDLQSTWEEFTTCCLDFNRFLTNDYIRIKERLLETELLEYKHYYAKLEAQDKLFDKYMASEQLMFRQDSLLFTQSIISAADYETLVRDYIGKQRHKAELDATMTYTQLSIIQTEQQLIDLHIQREKETTEYERTIRHLRQQMLTAIALWKDKYTVIAPMNGLVSLQSAYNEGQYVTSGTIFGIIIPDSNQDIVGHIQVSSSDFCKIKIGQTVNVKLHGFPYMEYGILKGTISYLSSIPQQVKTANGTTTVYNVEVSFPNGMRTTYDKELTIFQFMDGTCEIITKDMRLIEQFVQPIISIVKNQ